MMRRIALELGGKSPSLILEDVELEAWSASGVTKGIDRALALIEEDAGRQIAMNVARMLLACLKRAGGRSRYNAPLAAQVQPKSEAFDQLDRWIEEHLKGDLRVEALAERVHMSPRNFARAYARKRGSTPAKAVEVIRVEAARRRLEETEDRIGCVADDSGFSSEEHMRCSFVRILGIPPREYRKRIAMRPQHLVSPTRQLREPEAHSQEVGS
jgi:transcriptional regulator GlxA family with amidase domain